MPHCDFYLDSHFQLQAGADGDILTTRDCRLQEIVLAAASPQGDLFYDSDYGWGLMEFAHRQQDDFLKLELTQRIRSALLARGDIELASITVLPLLLQDALTVQLSFRFLSENELQSLSLSITPLNIEVTTID